MSQKTTSFGKGKGHIDHNNRKFVTPNVDRDRIKDNIIYKQESIEQAYEKIFGQAVRDYNAKQKRADRKKSVYAYMDEIRMNQSNKNGEKLFYEQVVGIGDMKDSGILTNPAEAEKCKRILDKYMRQWEQRNPNLYVFNAVLHMDEATPHLHIDYIPVGTGYKQGLNVRNSLTRAFENMGIDSAKSQHDNATIHWQERERAHIKELAKEQGIEIIELGEKRENLTLPEYKRNKQKAEELEEECNILQSYAEQFEEQCNALNEQIEASQKELDSLQEQISEKQAENNSLDLEFWKNEAIRASDENKMLIDTVHELKSGTMTGEALQNEHIALIEQSRQLEQDIKALERTAGVIDNLEERTCRKKNDDEFDFDLTDFFVNKPKSPEEIVKDLKPELRPELGNPDSFRKVKERLRRMIEEIKKRLSAVQKRIQYLQKVAPVPEKTVRKTPQR